MTISQTAIYWAARVGDHDAESLELAFSKKKIEERKAWLQNFSEGTFLDQSAEEISYSDFVDKVIWVYQLVKVCQRKISMTYCQTTIRRHCKLSEAT